MPPDLEIPATHEPRRAVFLDRDGVIVTAVVRDGLPHPPADLESMSLEPGATEACALLKRAGFLLVLATNQPDVGRGTQRRGVVEAMHAELLRRLPLDRVEVCYDARDGESNRRKPAPGMLLSASAEMGIDLATSFMVGDRWRDIDCGAAAGCRTVFIDRGYAETLRATPDFRVPDVLAAARVIREAAQDKQPPERKDHEDSP